MHSVLQALAINAHRAGQQINGVWVIGVGGRNLSLGTGLLSEDAVWRVLRDIRDRPGAPLILTRRGVGVEADTYALTTPPQIRPPRAAIERVRIEPVHDAWSILGHHLRRIYELVAYHGLTTRADLYAAAAVSNSAGDEALTTLQIAGLLIKTGHGAVATGPTSLDSLAAAHHTDGLREDRIIRYRAERDQWHAWLEDRYSIHDQARMDAIMRAKPADAPNVESTFWDIALANGPPDELDANDNAIELVLTMLGGRILTPG